MIHKHKLFLKKVSVLDVKEYYSLGESSFGFENIEMVITISGVKTTLLCSGTLAHKHTRPISGMG